MLKVKWFNNLISRRKRLGGLFICYIERRILTLTFQIKRWYFLFSLKYGQKLCKAQTVTKSIYNDLGLYTPIPYFQKALEN